MMRTNQLAVACVAVLVATAGQVQAAIVTYTNAGDFNAAASSLVLEDFNSSTLERFALGADYQFNGFTITASSNPLGTGPGAGIANTSRSDIDNSRRLVWGADTFGPNASGWGPQIVFTFDTPVLAFGFDWRNTDPTDSYKLVVLGEDFGAANTEVPYPRPRSLPGTPSSAQGFFGLVSDTVFTTVTLEHVTRGGFLNDMSMDNVRFSPVSGSATVPEPSSITLFGIAGCVAGVVAVCRRRREKKQEATV